MAHDRGILAWFGLNAAVGGVVAGLFAAGCAAMDDPAPAVADPLAIPRGETIVARADIAVIDGDTLKARGREIRVLHMNAPELRRSDRCGDERAAAEIAKREAERLIAGSPAVTVALDGRLDVYGRALADIRLADGRDFATAMIAAGVAAPYEHVEGVPMPCFRAGSPPAPRARSR